MSIAVGHHLAWCFQGIKSCCWLTCIEMLMHHKHGNIYGRGRTSHTAEAKREYKANKGSHIGIHADEYGLASNNKLKGSTDPAVWRNALTHGPVLAEGHYGWSRIGVGLHVIVVAGISKSGKLAYYNPNVFAVLPHPKDKISYFSIERCVELSRKDNLFGGGPFWQTTEDVAKQA